MIFIARFRVCTQPAENRLDINHDIQYYSGIRSTRARIRISAFLIVRNDSGVVNFVLGNIEQKKR